MQVGARIRLFFANRLKRVFRNKAGREKLIEGNTFHPGCEPLEGVCHDGEGLQNLLRLEAVDTVIVSHGHSDHGGGLEAILALNPTARVLLGKGAFDRHSFKLFGLVPMNVGLKKALADNRRFVFVDGVLSLDGEITLFNQVMGDALVPRGNRQRLSVGAEGRMDNLGELRTGTILSF